MLQSKTLLSDWPDQRGLTALSEFKLEELLPNSGSQEKEHFCCNRFEVWVLEMRDWLSGGNVQYAVIDLWWKLGKMSGRELNDCGVFNNEIVIEIMKVYSFSWYSFCFWCSKHFVGYAVWETETVSGGEIDERFRDSLKLWDSLNLLF